MAGLVLVGLILPLAIFATFAFLVNEQGVPAFDESLLLALHGMHTSALDRFVVVISHAGYLYFVVPFDITFTLWLAWRRHIREAQFTAIALGGSALLNLALKPLFARERPALWESIAPEHNFSFPSGHAMGSMSLACVLVLLAWPTRWRWPVIATMAAFVLLVGLSRPYLGVHYPSDILAGWAVAIAWGVAVYLLVFRRCGPWVNMA